MRSSKWRISTRGLSTSATGSETQSELIWRWIQWPLEEPKWFRKKMTISYLSAPMKTAKNWILARRKSSQSWRVSNCSKSCQATILKTLTRHHFGKRFKIKIWFLREPPTRWRGSGASMRISRSSSGWPRLSTLTLTSVSRSSRSLRQTLSTTSDKNTRSNSLGLTPWSPIQAPTCNTKIEQTNYLLFIIKIPPSLCRPFTALLCTETRRRPRAKAN